MKVPPDLLKRVRFWVEKAENDFRNAEHTLTLTENCPFDTICYHTQQGVEKYLKAIFVFHSIEFPKTNDLLLLLNFVPKELSLNVEPADLLQLNRYSVEVRYPGDWEKITREEAVGALLKANKVREIIRSMLPAAAVP